MYGVGLLQGLGFCRVEGFYRVLGFVGLRVLQRLGFRVLEFRFCTRFRVPGFYRV